MKPFDLEKALAGEKVVTKKGDFVTQLTLFEDKNLYFPLFGILNGYLCSWSKEGKAVQEGRTLFMAPTKEEADANAGPRIACICVFYKEGEGLD